MLNTTTKILVAVVALVGVILLVGYRFGFRKAGGDGVPTSSHFEKTRTNGIESFCESADTTHIHMMTCASQYFQFSYRWEKGFGGADIALDENTDVSIIDDTQGNETISLVKGRILITSWSPIVVNVRDVSVTIDGTATLVHYSWQDKLDVMVIEGTADVRQGTITSTVTSDRAVMIDTLPPYDALTPTTFNLDASTAKNFYDWALPN